tara:strand:- start:6712 stop:7563 length:852 start_codon:yes stop_codon:yes gene_type:complete
MDNNLLEYTQHGSDIGLPIFSPSIQRKRFFNMNSVTFSFMSVFTSAYLFSQALQCSSLISSSSHDMIVSTSYVYNLLFSLLVSYFLFTYSQIKTIKKPNIIIYWIFCVFGALGFALLGEVPWLKNITITKGWFGRLSPYAIVVVAIFTSVILFVGIKEYFTKIRFHDKCKGLGHMFTILIFYYALFLTLKANNAENIHYHVHHAIFSGLLSLWFIDWNNYIEMITHAILMGIVIEGIDFYGIQELFLLLFTDKGVSFSFSISMALIYLIILGISFKYYYKKQY